MALALIGAALPLAALADDGPQVQPAKPVDIHRLSGRWYEVARVPNMAEKDCAFAMTDWDPAPGGKFKVTQTCMASPDGPAGRVIRSSADPLDPAGNTKWRMNYFGGLIRRDYWILDSAADGQWLILGMPGKHFVWVFARRPNWPQAQREQAVQKIAAMGYDASRLVFPVTLAARGN